MISPESFYDWLKDAGVALFAGVPDSLLKDFCAYVTDHTPPERHVITANEGGAVALAMGHYLATGRAALVYLQNSGLGNMVNPLTSLADGAVYGIPMVLLVGWRGEPGKKDEPQHVQMGRVTCSVLEALGIDYTVLPEDPAAAKQVIDDTVRETHAQRSPRAIVVRKGTFSAYKLQNAVADRYPLERERAIARLVASLPHDAIVVSTTGKPSRELFEVREARGEAHDSDLLTVGGMGHASQIALGVALEQRDRPVYCVDGDGAALMHMGGLSTIATLAPPTFKHVVLNNAAHDSVGGQPTVGFDVDLCAVARACGYPHARSVHDESALDAAVAELAAQPGPAMLEIRIKKGSRKDLGRPTMTPAELKERFSRYVQNG